MSYLYHISNNDQPIACLGSANRFYWAKWGQEWVSSCPPAGSGRPPAHQPLWWLIKTEALSHKREGGIPFQQLGLPRDSSISFCLVHLHIQKTQWGHLPAQSCPTRTRVHPSKEAVCHLSLNASFTLSFLAYICVCVLVCVLQTAVQPVLSGGWPSQRHLLFKQLAFFSNCECEIERERKKASLQVPDVSLRKFLLYCVSFFENVT